MIRRIAILCVLTVAVCACVAQGRVQQNVQLRFSGYGAGCDVELCGEEFQGGRYTAGVYMLDTIRVPGQAESLPSDPLAGFCIELNQGIPHTEREYDIVLLEDAYVPSLDEPVGPEKAAWISELFGRYYDPAWNGTGVHSEQHSAEAEAFAIAVWEIVYEEPSERWKVIFDAEEVPGRFGARRYQTALADTWLSSLDGTGPMAELRALVNEDRQDYVVVIPEPASLVLLAAGAVLLRRSRGG